MSDCWGTSSEPFAAVGLLLCDTVVYCCVVYQMRTVAVDVPGRLSVCLSHDITRRRGAKTAEQVEVLFVVETP